MHLWKLNLDYTPKRCHSLNCRPHDVECMEIMHAESEKNFVKYFNRKIFDEYEIPSGHLNRVLIFYELKWRGWKKNKNERKKKKNKNFSSVHA